MRYVLYVAVVLYALLCILWGKHMRGGLRRSEGF